MRAPPATPGRRLESEERSRDSLSTAARSAWTRPGLSLLLWGLFLAALTGCEGATGPEDASPEARILRPADSASVSRGEAVVLEGRAEDEEEGRLSGAQLVWSSNLDGRLGSGATLTVDGLSAGPHGITLTATDSAGNRDTASVHLRVYRPPTIVSVTSPLPEVGDATIDGSDFSPMPAENTVLVSGIEATVEEAATDRLVVSVPDLGCLPAGTQVEITVARRGKAGEPHTVVTEPEEPRLSLPVGSQEIITRPGDFCVQLPASRDTSDYLMGVQSVSSAVEALTPIRVRSRTARSGSGTSPRIQPGDLEGASGAGELSPLHELHERRRAHRRAELRLRRREREQVDLSSDMLRPGDGDAARVSREITGVTAGDTVDVRVPVWPGDDPCDEFVAATGVVETVGTEGIIVQDTAAPEPTEGGYTDQDLQDFSDGLDEGFPALESYFGSPGDRDGNGRVVAFFTPATTRGDGSLLGFVYAGDLTSRSSCAASSEGEIFYGRVPDTGTSAERLRYLMPATIQHEMTHVIQMSRRRDYLGTYLSEAQATLGEEIVGHAVTDRQIHRNYGSEVALDPDRSDSVQWYPDGFYDLARYFGFDDASSRIADAPEECGWWRADAAPCDSRSLWYGVGWSFLRWVSDTYGPDYPGGEEQLHRDIIVESDRGVSKVASLVESDARRLMARWAAALYLDDRVEGLRDQLTLASWNLHDIFEAGLGETAELKPYEREFSSWQTETEVRASSTAYFRISGPSRPATAISVGSQGGGHLPPDMQVWIVRVR